MLSEGFDNRLRGKMQDIDEKQTCPFCEADWGGCEHYRLLAEWESFAAQVEGKVKRPSREPEQDEARDIRLSS